MADPLEVDLATRLERLAFVVVALQRDLADLERRLERLEHTVVLLAATLDQRRA